MFFIHHEKEFIPTAKIEVGVYNLIVWEKTEKDVNIISSYRQTSQKDS